MIINTKPNPFILNNENINPKIGQDLLKQNLIELKLQAKKKEEQCKK